MRKTWHLNQLFPDFYHISRTKTMKSIALDDQQQSWTINTFRDRLLKIGGRVTKHARKVILTLDNRIQEQFDGLFWRAWERLNALWQ